MREFVDQQHGRVAAECRVQVEFAPRDAAVAHLEVGQALEAFEQALGLGASVRLDVADDDVAAGRARAARRLEHRIGLANAGRGPEEDAQASARGARLLALERRQDRFRIAASGFAHGRQPSTRRARA